MNFFVSPSFLETMAWLLAIVGGVGLASLRLFPLGRRTVARTLAVLFVVSVAGSGALAWGAQKARAVERDITPAQQAALTAAFARFPDMRIEILVEPDDKEAKALALEIAAAVQAARGAAPRLTEHPVSAVKGVVIGVRTREEPVAGFLKAVGRTLMAARVATISDIVPDLPDGEVRLVVGRKP
jgi:hypothetical protein